jgi:hypothetical protein
MSQTRDDRQKDLFRPALEQIIAMGHPLVRLAQRIDWAFLDRRLGEVYRSHDGHPPLPVRLVAGLLILKHMHSLSDEALCARWVENPLYELHTGVGADQRFAFLGTHVSLKLAAFGRGRRRERSGKNASAANPRVITPLAMFDRQTACRVR